MYRIIAFYLFVLIPFFGMSQANNPFGIKKELCFQKALDRIDQRYPHWDCDIYEKRAVDCNQSLEADPESNAVYLRSNGKPFTGSCVTCHNNGIKEHTAYFENGRIHGSDTSYYSSGCPQVIRSFIHGIENGKWTFYNDTSGLVAWEIEYFNGEKNGQSIYFRQTPIGTNTAKYMLNGAEESWPYTIYENDTLKVENYVEGIIHGEKKEYFWPGSKIKRVINYNMGIFHGSFTEYNKSGQVLQEIYYNKGKKEGDWKYYYDNGQLLRTETWKNDIKDGEFKVFYIQGHLQSLETYKKGRKEGRFLEYFPDEKIKRESYYKKDQLIEDHVFDKYGNEIETFGVSKGGKEDDELPTKDKNKKKSKKSDS